MAEQDPVRAVDRSPRERKPAWPIIPRRFLPGQFAQGLCGGSLYAFMLPTYHWFKILGNLEVCNINVREDKKRKKRKKEKKSNLR